MEQHKPYFKKQIFVCTKQKPGPKESCHPKDSEEIHKKLKEYVKDKGLQDKIRISKSLCQNLCSHGPVVSIYPENIIYKKVTIDDVGEITKKHIDVL